MLGSHNKQNLKKKTSLNNRCYAWWEGARCEKRMMHIPYKPLTERMLQEPFWLGLITVFVVLAVIGLVWCAKRHFPEKIEKLLAEEAFKKKKINFSTFYAFASHIIERTTASVCWWSCCHCYPNTNSNNTWCA
jgi:hypothetical protein